MAVVSALQLIVLLAGRRETVVTGAITGDAEDSGWVGVHDLPSWLAYQQQWSYPAVPLSSCRIIGMDSSITLFVAIKTTICTGVALQ